jgi:putative ABC transport system permease protein
MWFLISLAWRNLWRHARRTILTAITIAAGLAMCMSMLAFVDGMYGTIRDVLVTRMIGHVQIHHTAYVGKRSLYDTVPGAADLLVKLDALDGVRGVTPRVLGGGLAGLGDETVGVQLLGIDPVREEKASSIRRTVKQGEMLPPDAAQGALLGDRLAKKLGAKLGDEILVVTSAADGSIGNALFKVIGVFHTGSTGLDRAGVYLHYRDLQEVLALPDQVHEIIVNGSSDQDGPVAELLAAVKGVTGDKVASQAWWEVQPSAQDMLAMQGVTSWIMVLIVFGVAALGVVNTMLMSVFERTRELGVLRALGVRPLELVALVCLESLFLALVAVIGGLIVGGLLDVYLVTQGISLVRENGESFDFGSLTFDPIIYGRVTAKSLLLPITGAFTTAVLAALWPAVRAARLRPVDAIRAE